MQLSNRAKLITFLCGLIGLISSILGIIQYLEDRKSNQNEETIKTLLLELQRVQKSELEKENLEKTVKNLLDYQKTLYHLIEKELHLNVEPTQNDIIDQTQKFQTSKHIASQNEDSLSQLIQKNEDIGNKINELENTRIHVANSVHSVISNPSFTNDPYIRAQIEELQKFDQFLKENLENYRQFNENFYRDFANYKPNKERVKNGKQ